MTRQLRALQQRLDRDAARKSASACKRDAGILAALAEGMTHREIAEALGVRHGVVGKVAAKAKATTRSS